MLNKNTDYVICTKATFIDSKSPMQQGRGVCISTKNYVFLIPTMTTGIYPLIQTFKSHKHFEGVSIMDGLDNVIGNSKTVQDLEESMIALLENNERNVLHIPSHKEFLISGFFVKNNMRLINSRFNYHACILQPKAIAKEFREFHGK